MWRASVLTIFPEMFPGPLALSLAGKGLASGIWKLDVHDIRAHATDKYRTVDDTPAGGGPGMVMKADILARALDAVPHDTRPRLLMSPRGARLTQTRVAKLALLTLTGPSGSPSAGVVITRLCGQVATLQSSPTVLADSPISASTSTRILRGKPPRATWSAPTLLGL